MMKLKKKNSGSCRVRISIWGRNCTNSGTNLPQVPNSDTGWPARRRNRLRTTVRRMKPPSSHSSRR